jgi:thioredoxin 1
MSKVLELTHETFQDEVLKSDIPVLVDFWAPWCAPCVMMAPILDELSEDKAGKVKVAKLDIENPNHQMLATQFGIQSIPNMKLFKGGKMIKDFIGLRAKDQLVGEIEDALK